MPIQIRENLILENPALKPLPFTLGADPECVFTVNDIPLQASSLINTLFAPSDKVSSADRENLLYRISRNMGVGTSGGILGYDGHSSTGEVRPKPDNTPHGVVENLRKIFRSFADASNGEISAITSSRFDPIGGHVHIGLPRELSENSQKLDRLARLTLSWLVPLCQSDSEYTKNLRNGMQGRYGAFDDYRCETPPGASVKTIELRSPSAEWLTTPKIAEATLAYIACVWNEALNHPKSFTRDTSGYVPTRDGGFQTLQKLRDEIPHIFRRYCVDIGRSVRHFELYPQYKDLIDYILDVSAVRRDKEAIGHDLMQGWGLLKDVDIESAVCIPTLQKQGVSFNVRERHISVSPDSLHMQEMSRHLLTLVAQNIVMCRVPVYLFGLAKVSGFSKHVALRVPGKGRVDILSIEDGKRLSTETIGSVKKSIQSRGMLNNLDKTAYAIGIPYSWRVKVATSQDLRELAKKIYEDIYVPLQRTYGIKKKIVCAA